MMICGIPRESEISPAGISGCSILKNSLLSSFLVRQEVLVTQNGRLRKDPKTPCEIG
jgi:hypothetical protein